MFKKILVPLDGSELAARILPQVEDLAKLFQARVVLMTIGSSGSGEVEEATMESANEEIALIPAVKYLKNTADALRNKGINVTWLYKPGTPTREIIAYAASHQFDLLAMASHGAGEVAWILGSVAEKIVSHATVPVLLIRVLEIKPPVLKNELSYFSM